MEFPENLKYSKEHEWALAEGDVVTIGITAFAQDQLGDIVFVELPEVGAVYNQSDTFGVAESVKTVSDLYCPVSGEVIEVNTILEDSPQVVNSASYTDGWMLKVKMTDASQLDGLMSASEYGKYIKEKS